jgi:dolichol-phosphate mannosyltransferase
MDADLQDPPKVIEDLLREWSSGYQIVFTKRRVRNGESRFKKLSAKLYYRMLNWLSEIDVPIDVGDFRLMDREVINAYLALPERGRYARGMIAWLGFTSTTINFDRDPRYAGKSSYSVKKLVEIGMTGVLQFSIRPLRVVTWTGWIFSFLSIMLGIFAFLSKLLFNGYAVPGYTSIIVLLTLIGGIQLIGIGIVGEYLGRVYGEVKQRPIYFVNSKLSNIKSLEN